MQDKSALALAKRAPFNVSVDALSVYMASAKAVPKSNASYYQLYLDPEFRQKQKKKVRHAKKQIRPEAVKSALSSNSFWKIFEREKEHSPCTGDRDSLYFLTGN